MSMVKKIYQLQSTTYARKNSCYEKIMKVSLSTQKKNENKGLHVATYKLPKHLSSPKHS